MRVKKLLACVLSLAMVFSLFSSLGLTFTANAGHYDWDLESPLERNKTLDDWDTLHEMIENTDQPLRWVFTGSSTTANSGNYSNSYRSYTEIFESRMKTEYGRTEDVFINSAVGGWKIPNVSWTEIANYNPDIVYFAIGKNDADGSVTPEEAYIGLTLLVVQAREAGILPIVATANGLGTGYSTKDTYDSVYAPIIRRVAYEQNAILIDHNAHWLNNEAKAEAEWFRSDNLHCNQKGYLELAQTIFWDLGLWDENSLYCSLKSDDIDDTLPYPFFGDEEDSIVEFDPDHGVEPLVRWQVNQRWDGSQKLIDVSDSTTKDGEKVLDALNDPNRTSGTIVYRYRTTSTASAKRFFGVSDATGTGFVLGAGSEGRAWALALNKGNTGDLLRMGSTALSDGKWHTIVLVADEDSLLLYEEGVKYDLTTQTGSFNPFNTNGKGTYSKIVLGGNLNGSGAEGNQFIGDVSYIEILDEMLTDEQATAISQENDEFNTEEPTDPENPDASNPTHPGGVEPDVRFQVNKSYNGSQSLDYYNDAVMTDGRSVLDVMNDPSVTSGTFIYRYKTTSTAAGKRMFSISDDSGNGFALGGTSEGRNWALPITGGSAPSSLLRLDPKNLLSNGEWHTVVLVCGDGVLYHYVDGVKYDMSSATGAFNPFNTNGKGDYTKIMFGGNLNSSGAESNKFIGDVSYLDILTTMLTDEQAIEISKESMVPSQYAVDGDPSKQNGFVYDGDRLVDSDTLNMPDPVVDFNADSEAGKEIGYPENGYFDGATSVDLTDYVYEKGGEQLSLLEMLKKFDSFAISTSVNFENANGTVRYITATSNAYPNNSRAGIVVAMYQNKLYFSVNDSSEHNDLGITDNIKGDWVRSYNNSVKLPNGNKGYIVYNLSRVEGDEFARKIDTYLNGVLIKSVTFDLRNADAVGDKMSEMPEDGILLPLIDTLTIGAQKYNDKYSAYAKGTIEYVRFYDQSLTEAQAQYESSGRVSYPESTFSGIASAKNANTDFVFYGGANILGTMDTVIERNFINYLYTSNVNGRQATFTGSMADLTAALENPNFQGGEVVVLMPEVFDSWGNRLIDTDETAFKQSLYEFVSKALIRNNSRVLLITPAPMYGQNEAQNSIVSDYAQWTREFADQYGLPLVDFNLYFTDAAAQSEQVKRNWFTDDGFMNSVAHAEAARLLCDALGVSNGGIDNKTFRNESLTSGEEYDNLAPVVTVDGTTATIDFGNILSDAQYAGQTLTFKVNQTVNGETTTLTLTADGNKFTVEGLDANALYTFELVGTTGSKTVHFKSVSVSTVSDVDAALEQLNAAVEEIAGKVGEVEGDLRQDRLDDLKAAIAAIESADEADKPMLAAKALLLAEKAKTDVVTLDRTCLENLVAEIEGQELIPDAVAAAKEALAGKLTQAELTQAYADLYKAYVDATTPATPPEDTTDTFTRIEAESGLLSSGQISSDPAASGGQKLTYMAGTPAPNVKFILNAPQAGIYTVKIGYATNTDNLPLIVFAGEHYTITPVAKTASMTTYEEVSVKIQLEAGENALTVRGSDDANLYLDLDYIEIPTVLTRVNKDSNTDRGYYEAEWAEAYRCKINLEDDGTGYVTNIWDNDNPEYASRLRFTVDAEKAGDYTMTVRYRVTKVYSDNGNLAQHNLAINGVDVGMVDYGTGTSSWKTVQVPVTLIEGLNTIAFSKSVAKLGDVDIDVIHINFTEEWDDDYLTGGSDVTLGDVNNDGHINSSDARLVLQHTVELISLEGDELIAADVTEDGVINSNDARKILQMTVELA